MFDPTGLLSPILVPLKVMFQQLCTMSVYDWDSPLTGEHLNTWYKWIHDLEKVQSISVPRYYFGDAELELLKCTLVGFGDASKDAYAANVYLARQTEDGNETALVASKTRVTPIKKITIPRLELLASVILSRLTATVYRALESVIQIEDDYCWTDSKTAYYWIKNGKEHKQFVQNRVDKVLQNSDPDKWFHVPGIDNPADIGTRGALPSEIENNDLWWHGPSWLQQSKDCWPTKLSSVVETTEEGELELKKKHQTLGEQLAVLITVKREQPVVQLQNVINCEEFNNYQKLLRVTAYIFRFCKNIRSKRLQVKVESSNNFLVGELSVKEISGAELLWVISVQSVMKGESKYEHLVHQLGLFIDERGIICSRGRLQNSMLPYETKSPMLLPRNNHFTKLVIEDCHSRVLHCGVKDTLVELRTRFWVPRGRQDVKFVIHHCLVCKKMTGTSYDKPPPGDLPSFRLCEVLAFTNVGVDMAGPLFIKVPGSNQESSTQKVWICLFTCGSSRAVHLEIVPTMNTDAFIRCLSRFCSRRGTPNMIISDNAKTFKVASKLLLKLFQSPEVQAFLTKKRIVWKFILEKSPWMGGFYERMVGLLKRILRKILANARLDYEELLTVVTEVESILNSRPISYVYAEETEEPICPSHLVTGKRLTSLPEYQETDLLPDNESLVTLTQRYQFVCTLLKHFWKRFSREYLVDL